MANTIKVLILCLVSLGAVAAQTPAPQQTNIPPDVALRSELSCHVEHRSGTNKKTGKEYSGWRARLKAVHVDGTIWTKNLKLRTTENAATEDCQLWIAMVAREREAQQKNTNGRTP